MNLHFDKSSRQKRWTMAGLPALLLLGLSARTLPAPDPLAQTRWTGLMSIPSSETVELNFSGNKFDIYLAGQVVETSSYQTRGDTVFFRKLSGGSPCGTETGSYLYQIKANKLLFTAIKDDCQERQDAFSDEGYTKMVK